MTTIQWLFVGKVYNLNPFLGIMVGSTDNGAHYMSCVGEMSGSNVTCEERNSGYVAPRAFVEVDSVLYHPYLRKLTKGRGPELLHRGPLSFFDYNGKMHFAVGDMGRLHPVRETGLLQYALPGEDVHFVSPSFDWAIEVQPISDDVIKGVFIDAYVYTSAYALDMERVVGEVIGPNLHFYNKVRECFSLIGMLR